MEPPAVPKEGRSVHGPSPLRSHGPVLRHRSVPHMSEAPCGLIPPGIRVTPAPPPRRFFPPEGRTLDQVVTQWSAGLVTIGTRCSRQWHEPIRGVTSSSCATVERVLREAEECDEVQRGHRFPWLCRRRSRSRFRCSWCSDSPSIPRTGSPGAVLRPVHLVMRGRALSMLEDRATEPLAGVPGARSSRGASAIAGGGSAA